MNFDENLGRNFKFGEMIKYRKDNIPDLKTISRLTQLCCNLLDPIRDKFGKTIVTSGYRNKEYNKEIGGADNSSHILGEAADIITVYSNLKETFLWIKDNLEYDIIIHEKKDDKEWIHVSYRINKNRKHSLLYRNGDYSVYSNSDDWID